MKHNVLVVPCGTEIGLEIYRSLSFSTHFNVIGGSSTDDHGRYVYSHYIGDIPYVDDPDFIAKINMVIEAHDIELIMPAHDDVLVKLARAKADGQLKCEVVTATVETCELTRSKSKTYQAFEGLLPVPKLYRPEAISEQELPVFLKPDKSQGSKGTSLAKTLEDVTYHTSKDPDLLVLEYLPGAEYTIDCFTDKNGALRFCSGRERVRISNGISVNSKSSNKDFVRLAEIINKQLDLRGVWFFQVKENKQGELVLMEIAPRIAGTMALLRCKGVNLALLSLFDALGYDIEITQNDYEMTIDRALQNSYKHNIQYNHVYLDLDDLVILRGKVNPAVMAFVYQCVNSNIKVHLLTRHEGDLHQTLETHKLMGVFDDVVWVKDGDDKYNYVTETDAIFIDDSFAERKAVHDKFNIPVFDSHMIESLMDGF